MDEHDYDAAVGTINIEDITSDGINREILRQLKENDRFYNLWVVDSREGSREIQMNMRCCYCPAGAHDLGWLGYFISKYTTNLRELRLHTNQFQ